MIAEWTTLEATVNQIRLRLAAGFRAALSTKTPGLTTFQPILHVARICTASELKALSLDVSTRIGPTALITAARSMTRPEPAVT